MRLRMYACEYGPFFRAHYIPAERFPVELPREAGGGHEADMKVSTLRWLEEWEEMIINITINGL